MTGTVLDDAGKPVAGSIVRYALEDRSQRKGTLTDSAGRFVLRGLQGGPATLSTRSLPIKQKAQVALNLDTDKDGLEVRLGPIILPANLVKHEVLGMQLADVTPELKSAYDLGLSQGALILDPGRDFDRLGIGELSEGNDFFMAGDRRIGSVREFVDQIIAETGGRDADHYQIRVVYTFSKPEYEGSNTQYMKLTRADIESLKAVSARLAAPSR